MGLIPIANKLAPILGVGDTGFGQSRVMSSTPHIDGCLLTTAGQLDADSANLLLIRQAPGYWTLRRTAAGAETYHVRTTLQTPYLRTGEYFQYGGFGSDQQDTTQVAKGLAILDVFAIYQPQVVALTAASIQVTAWANFPAANPVAHAFLGATGLPTAVNAVGNPTVSTVALSTAAQVMIPFDTAWVDIEFAFTMAATGIIDIAGLGAHVAFNLT
jgi:hypothetical protein